MTSTNGIDDAVEFLVFKCTNKNAKQMWFGVIPYAKIIKTSQILRRRKEKLVISKKHNKETMHFLLWNAHPSVIMINNVVSFG